ncbi:hypothetical protein ICJ57_06080 [Geoglobus acetivorans]|nr:hypothetical protein [Geoglobus acetivorans]
MEFAAVLLAMLVPFIAIKSHDLAAYIYWTAVVATYLAYISYRRWEIE